MLGLTGFALLTVLEAPGTLLTPGMQLVYASGGTEQAPWSIESVSRDTSLGGMTACRVVRLRTTPTRPEPETRAYCTQGDTLFSWDASGTTRALRPVGPRMTFELRGRGSVSIYETADAAEETISGLRIPVIATTVTTRDSTGRAVRRLRERYAIGLATATGGTFEVADSTQSSGWRTERSFDLVRIVRR